MTSVNMSKVTLNEILIGNCVPV